MSHTSVASWDHCKDSYCLVSSRTKIWIAAAAAKLAVEFSRVAMSMVRNIRERNAENPNKRNVGRCLGLMVIAPVVGSIIICCMPAEDDATTMPREDPGAAIYGNLFAFGVPSLTDMVLRFLLSKCFRTKISS